MPSSCYEPELIPDPLEIGDVLCKMLALSDGSGISGPSIEAKPWLAGKQLPLGFNTRWSSWDGPRIVRGP